MKIKELIEIIHIDKEASIPLIPVDVKNNTPWFDVKDDGVYYWKDETVWSMMESMKRDQKYVYNKGVLLEKWFPEFGQSIDIVKERYMTVYELMKALDEYCKKQENPEYCTINLIERYVKEIKETISEGFDCTEINGFSLLKNIIQKDTFFSEVFFIVTVWDCLKKEQYQSPLGRSAKGNYSFGNKRFHEDLDKIVINIFLDEYNLTYQRRGSVYEKKYYDKIPIQYEYDHEKRIIKTLSFWNKGCID